MTRLLTKANVKDFAMQLVANGCTIESDGYVNHVKCFDGDTVVFAALSKGPGQPWIVRFTESDRIKWHGPDDPK